VAITGHGCSSKDDISKKIPPKPGNGLIFKGLLLRSYGRISGYQPERVCQTLKNKTIGNKAHRYRLERISSDRVCIARLLRASGFAGLFKTASNLLVAYYPIPRFGWA